MAGMTVELTLNTDIGLLSVGNADTGEDFGPAMNNLYEDIGVVAGGGISLGGGGGREARIDGRGAASLSAANAAAAAAAAAATPIGGIGGGRGGGGIDPQGTLWPAFAMHQPGDSVTFLPRRADDGYDMPRTLPSSSASAASAGGGGGGYRSLQGLMGGGGGLTDGMVGGGGGGPGGGAVATQALPLGYPDPILVEHVCAALKTATGVLREAGQGMGSEGGDETDDGFCVVAR